MIKTTLKKAVCVICVAAALLSTPALAARITGEVLFTDIRAYIDGHPIKSYNINGWTGIVAEDLREYGFDVDWDAENRSLYVHRDIIDKSITASYEFGEITKPVGSHSSHIYATDIKTHVDGCEVNGFNIDGWTIIYIDELEAFGDVVWDEEKREISFTSSDPWSINLSPENIGTARHDNGGFDLSEGICHISGTFTKNEDGSFDVSGENLDHLSWIMLDYSKRNGLRLGISMAAMHLFGDEEFASLCYDMSTVRYDGEILQDNADIANEHTKITVNDIPVNILEVTQGKGNNHQDYYFVLDLDINRDDINKITIKCGI